MSDQPSPPTVWSSEQITALAPDAQVAKDARPLAAPHQWQATGSHMEGATALYWGEHLKKQAASYRVVIDANGPAFKCTCPSRKQPCKHAIALFLLAQSQPALFVPSEPPKWVAQWQQKRQPAAPSAEKPAAPARRSARREKLVQQGIAGLRLWLDDLARQGIANLPTQPQAFWDAQAARLVDAQAPGLALWVREMARLPYSGEGWPERLLARMGRLHLLLEAASRLDALPPLLQEEVRRQIGWTQDQADLLHQPGVRDNWWVLSSRERPEWGLRVQRTWLWGQTTHRSALLLEFAVGKQQSFGLNLPPGAAWESELVYYPAPHPQRALLKPPTLPIQTTLPTGYTTWSAALTDYSAALAANPWLERYLWPLDQMTLLQRNAEWRLIDSEHAWLPLHLSTTQGLRLLALSGGGPLNLVCEWDGVACTLLSVWNGATLLTWED